MIIIKKFAYLQIKHIIIHLKFGSTQITFKWKWCYVRDLGLLW